MEKLDKFLKDHPDFNPELYRTRKLPLPEGLKSYDLTRVPGVVANELNWRSQAAVMDRFPHVRDKFGTVGKLDDFMFDFQASFEPATPLTPAEKSAQAQRDAETKARRTEVSPF